MGGINFNRLTAKKSLAVVEIGNDWLKVVEGDFDVNSATISNMSFTKLATIKETVSSALSGIFKELNLGKRGVIICIPRHLVTIRILEFPSTDPKEIEDMVALQASKQTPYSKEEIFSAHKTLSSDREGYAKVMLVIARRNIISERIDTLEKAGIQVSKVAVSTEGVYNWFNAAQMPHMKEEASQAVAILDIDSNYSDFIIVRKGKLVFTRNILIGANQLIEEMDKWQDKFVEEVKHSIELYRDEEKGSKAIKIFLSGAAKNIKGLCALLNARLDMPAEETSADNNLQIKAGADLLINPDNKFISVTALFGIAVNEIEAELDLSPPELRIRKQMEMTRRQLIIMGVLFTSIVMLASFLLLFTVYNKNAYLSRLNQEISNIKNDASSIEKMRLRINMVENRRDAKGSSINILSEIYRLTPKEIYLTNISIEERKKVVLRGRAGIMSDIFKYVTTLETSGLLENVNTSYATAKKEENTEYIDFEITSLVSMGNNR